MNWLLVGVLFTLIFCTIKGYQKGFIRVAFSLVSFFLVIAFVVWAEPYISSYLEKNTEISETIQQKCEEQLRISAQNNTEQQDLVQQGEEGQNSDQQMAENQNAQAESLKVAGIILPKALEQPLVAQGIGAADQILESSGVYAEIAKTLAHFIISGISFFLAFIVAVILVRAISGILNLVSHLPIIHGVNKMLGIAAGFVQGIFYVWLFFYLIAICCTSSFGMLMNRYIDQSSFLTYLYQNNLLLQILMQFF